jgi:NOL1/NOP2/sun family putative RNA methylase
MTYTPKPEFEARMISLLGKQDYERWLEENRKPGLNSIRCNTIKITPEELKKKLENKGWKISQPFSKYKEAMVIESKLGPGELGNSLEHLQGLYYVQELSSMLPIIALNPKPDEFMLDLCASPGSKTTQASALMQNRGTILANDKDVKRMLILSQNAERCSCSNIIITMQDAVQLCKKLKKLDFKFDKILLDLPCSGEGTIKSSPETFEMWNIKMIEKLARMQRKIASSSIELLKENGEMIYSTCTHSPEENEANINFLKERFNLKIKPIRLELKCRKGIESWKDEKFSSEINNCCRIYPQDNQTEGFFLAKLRK